jgi:DNA-binding IclR family transcriptional regulator
LISLAGVALGRLSVRGVAEAHLDKLVEISQETINVAVVDGQECVSIEHIPGPQSLRYVGWICRRMPFHATACGRVLLAYASPEERATMLRFPLTRYTAQTIGDSKILEDTLKKTRQQGYAIVHEEFSEGFSAIAAPVYNHAGRVIAAISIAGPTFRMGRGEIISLIEPLLETTHTVSAELGHTAPTLRQADHLPRNTGAAIDLGTICIGAADQRSSPGRRRRPLAQPPSAGATA